MKYTKLIAVLSVLAVLATFAFVLLHRPPPAQAQVPSGVCGYVIEFGSPVSGRVVKLHTSGTGCPWNNPTYQTTTNDQGYYQLFYGNGKWVVEDACQDFCVTVYNNQVRQDFNEQCF